MTQPAPNRNTIDDDSVHDSGQLVIDQIAAALCRRGLRLPALIALEAGRPLAFLGGQLLWMAQPALSLFLPTAPIKRVARLLEEPAAVTALIAQLEAKEG